MKTLELGEVALKVSSLEKGIEFYTTILGMTVHEKNAGDVLLGTKTHPLLRLIYDANFREQRQAHTGLYHTAYLLPEAGDLGVYLKHFVKIGFQLDGAGDHLYSQALYFHDFDGNGIEIYADRPRSEWLIAGDGTITTDTREVDVDGLFASAGNREYEGMPEGTILGHMHLQIADLNGFRHFYHDVLNLDIKTVYPGALFISRDGYHHHIAGNTWVSRQLKPLAEDELGLAYYTIKLADLEQVKKNLEHYTEIPEGILIRDPNGINVRLTSLGG